MKGIDWLREGIHDDIEAEDYHSAGLTKEPALSASIAKLLISHSPLHAWTAHPMLNPNFERAEEAKFDVGTAAHELLLRGNDIVHIVEADSWRTNAAKDARDEARKDGLVPLLEKDWKRVEAMAAAVRTQLEHLDANPPLLADGKPEQTIVWKQDGITLRGRLDWLRDDLTAIDDVKTTSASANPHDWSRRTFWTIGADLQAVMYVAGIKALTGRTPRFRFLVCEDHPPYAISVVDLAPSVTALADRKLEYAIKAWRRCLKADEWPAYTPRVASVDIDSWQEADFLSRTWTPDDEAVAA